jgi:alkylhydroperoxidase/carboxymuconolactone decarboxylase family protein YurZ
MMTVSDSFRIFLEQAPQFSGPWMQAVQQLSQASSLDARTRELAYLAVLAAVGLTSGVAFHAGLAKQAGASRQDVISAVLLGLPAAGMRVIQSLPAALEAFDKPRQP